MPNKQRKILTLKEKVDVINIFDKEKLSVRELAKRCNIGKTQAADIIKNRNELMLRWSSNANVNQKRTFCKTEGLNVDKLCYEWFLKARNNGIPISGTLVRSKAKDIAEKLGYKTFKASVGWLEKFRIRHNISFKTISGEAANINSADVGNFIEKIPLLLKGYSPKNVYNADETGLFFRTLPDKTLSIKGEKCVGGKLSKERVTILHCANMAGDKEKLLLIGKSHRPRAFKNINVNSLPVTYRANRKAWMTCDIMKEWLLQFDNRMGLQKRKILLFLDNAGSHPRDLKLQNIKIIFLPPNATSVCQPLDQGIIKCFKGYYRTTIVKHILTKIDSVSSVHQLSKTIDLLDAIYFINSAWNKVSSLTIQNCFRKSGISFELNEGDDHNFDAEDDLPLSMLAEMIKAMAECGYNIDSNDFINMDNDLSVEDGNIEILINEPPSETERSDEDSDHEPQNKEEEEPIKSYQEALRATTDLKLFAKRSGDTEALQLTTNLQMYFENALIKKKVKQTTMLDFLK